MDYKVNDIEINDGFNIMYAKNGGRPKNCWLDTRREVVEFLMENLNDIDLLCVNDVIIDKYKLVQDNLKLIRYLKIKRLYEL